jgi:alkyl hydroperoxide reductase subunit AhpC
VTDDWSPWPPASGAIPADAAPVGYPAPPFSLECTNVERRGRARRTLDDYAGQWLVLLFYPRDFSFVCPTELTSYSAKEPEFRQRQCAILAVGVDTIELHEEWLRAAPEAGGLGPLRFPLASDEGGVVAQQFGVYVKDRRVAGRGLFIVDPAGALQYKTIHNLRVGRSADETLRVLDALQAGGLCASTWTLGDGTIDPAQVLGPGRVLGHYRVVRKLGEGGFGQVFQAWDLWLPRMVAIKVLRPGRVLEQERVIAEARPAARLRHPGICTVFAVEVQDGLPVIAMEYLAGEPLSARIRREPLPPDDARIIGHQIALAMDASHAEGVVHGDLKPGNIMVLPDGMVKVLDFGLGVAAPVPDLGFPPGPTSAASGQAEVRTVTSPPPRVSAPGPTPRPSDPSAATFASAPQPVPGMFRGTPQYMSPEHASARTVGPKSDVFSLGLVLYEMLTGKRAVPTRSLRSAMRLVRDSKLQSIPKQLPPPFRAIAAACLSPKPDDRPTMATVAEWLAAG